MYGVQNVWSSIEGCAAFYYYLFLFIYLFQAVYGGLSSIEGCATFYLFLSIYLFCLFISVCVWSIEFYRRMCYFLFLSIYLFISGCVWSIQFCRRMCYFLFLFIYLFQAVYGVLSSIEECATFYFYLLIYFSLCMEY